MPEALLAIDDLQVEFRTDEGVVKAVDGVSYRLEKGEVLAVLGESGSGKTVHARAILRDPGLATGTHHRRHGPASRYRSLHPR